MKKRPRVALLIETSNSYGRGLLRGIHAYVRDHGPWSTYLPEQGRGDPPPGWLKNWNGDGIIARIENRQIAQAIGKLKLPVVDVSAARALPSTPWVETDDDVIVRLAVEHLIERGFKNFGFCGDARFAWSRLRGAAMERLLAESGRKCHAIEIGSKGSTASRPVNEEAQLTSWLKSLPRPIGIFACYDIRGHQLLEICRRNDIAVPEQVAVLGVDNDELLCALADPPLSSVAPDTHRTGYVAAELLDQMMKGQRVPAEPHLVKPLELITRQSTDVLAVDDPHVAQAARFIREHACDGVNVEDVLTRVPLTRRALECRFKKLLGRTPHEEIQRVQLRRVEQLLKETDLSISAIADRAGYKYGEYLSAAFKRKYGITPGEYRSASKKAGSDRPAV